MDARRWLTLGSVFCMLVLLSNCNQDTTVFGPQDTKAFASGFAGKVVDRKGKGVSGALVTALPGGVTTVSGDSGRFELGNLASGTYRLSLSKVDYRDTSVGDSVALGLRETKTVLPQALQYRYGSIRGKVLDSSGAPQFNAGVVVQEQDASVLAVDGSFRLSRVEPGKIKLFSAVSGYGYGTREVELRADSQVEVELRIDHKGGTVTGKVTKDDGVTPLSGASVSAVGGALRTVTQSDGSYSLGQVPQTASLTIVSGDQKAQVNGVQVAEGGRASLPDLHLSQVPTGTLPALLSGMSLGVTTDSVVTLVVADAMGSDTSWHVRRYLWSLDAGRTWDSTSTGVLRLHPAQLGWAEGLHRVKVRMRLYRILGISVLDSTSAVATIDVRLLPPPDITPPHLARVSPLKDTTYLAWLDSMATVEWKVTDDRRLDTAILDDLPGSQQGSHLLKSYSFPVGVTTVRAWARDSAGNEARDSVVFVRSHKPARDSSLSLLVVGLDTIHSTLVPAFASGRLDYVDTVSATDSVVWVRAFAKDTAGTVVTIAGTASRTKSVKLNAAGSSTPIRVVVRAGDGDTLAYVVDVFRRAATTSDSSIPWNNAIAYGTLLDSRDGKSYRTVKIGTQTWMAENLNYRNTTGSADTVGVCYNNSADSCAKYGRLYTWPETMKGAASSATIPSGVQGVCPSGWHVPSDGEWDTLVTAAGGSAIAGLKLKSTTGWIGNTGMDTYGFRAMPGGNLNASTFNDVGSFGDWWSAAEGDTSSAWDWYMGYNLASTGRFNNIKTYGFSLRCVQGTPTLPARDSSLKALTVVSIPSGASLTGFASRTLSYTDSVAATDSAVSVTAIAGDSTDTIRINGVVGKSRLVILGATGTNTPVRIVVKAVDGDTLTYTVNVARKAAAFDSTYGIPWNTSIAYGTLLDSRDGKSYRTVKIGTQTWMAENLNYRNTTGSADTVGVCYNNSADSCAKYGRLYTWADAMTICPNGWKIPNDSDWYALLAYVEDDSRTGKDSQAVYLKSASGWRTGGSGTDVFGFRAIGSGFNGISYLQDIGGWWSRDANGGDASYWFVDYVNYGVSYRNSSSQFPYLNKQSTVSVRCLENSASVVRDSTLKPLTVTANAQTKVYGEADPTLTYTVTGLDVGDTLTGTLSRAAGKDVGKYAINQGSLAAGSKYALTYVGADLVITPKSLSIVGATAPSKVYDGTTAAIVNGAALSGVVNSDDVSLVLGLATFATKDTDTGKVVTVTGSSLSGADAGNYRLTEVSGLEANIVPKTISVTVEPKSKVSGAADPVLTYLATGLVAGDAFTGSLTRAAGEAAGRYPITMGTLSAGPNYALAYVGDSLTITANGTGNKLTAAALGLDASWNQTVSTYDTFTDTRDGHLYRSVKIGNQVWMAENLNYAGTTKDTGKCYDNADSNCVKYGRLYTWLEVMAGASSSGLSPSGVKGICPMGWHIPSLGEWTTLDNFADPSGYTNGTNLKSIMSWNVIDDGKDLYGFRALPGGDYNVVSFFSVGDLTYWWSATEGDVSFAYSQCFGCGSSHSQRSYGELTNGFSLRCTK